MRYIPSVVFSSLACMALALLSRTSVRAESRTFAIPEKNGVLEITVSTSDASQAVLTLTPRNPTLVIDSQLIADPPRIVIDIKGAVERAGRTVDLKGLAPIQKARIGRHPDKVRVVVDLEPGASYRFNAVDLESSKILTIAKDAEARTVPAPSPGGTSTTHEAPTATPTGTSTVIRVTETWTAAPLKTAIPTSIATATVTPSLTPLATATQTPVTPEPFLTSLPTIATLGDLAQLEPTATITPTATIARTPTETAERTPTNAMERTATPTKTPTYTKTAEPTKTPTATRTPTATKTPLFTRTPTPTKTATASATPTSTKIPTISPTPTLPKPTSTAVPQRPLAFGTTKQQLLAIRFEYLSPENIPAIKLLLSQRPQFKLTRRDENSFIVRVANCSLSGEHVALPLFPPKDFVGFTSVKANTNDGCEIVVGVDPNSKIAGFARNEEILVRTIGSPS